MFSDSQQRRCSQLRSWAGAISATLLTCLTALPAQADFAGAFARYQAGELAAARAEFLQLAELGSSASQFNLAAMALRGQATEEDLGAAAGWLRAALENGSEQITQEKLLKVEEQLNEAQRRTAADIVAQYGRAALRERVLPTGRSPECAERYTDVRTVQRVPAEFPEAARRSGQDGLVVVEFAVGLDGLAHDPEIVISLPGGFFEKPSLRAVFKSRFAPAMFDGKPLQARHVITYHYSIKNGEGLLDEKGVQAIKERAAQGLADAKFVAGVLGLLNESLEISRDDARALLLSAAQTGYAPAQYFIANNLIGTSYCSGEDKSRPWLRQAGRDALAAAKIKLARNLLRDPAAGQQVDEIRVLLGDAGLSANIYALKHAAGLLSSWPLANLGNSGLALRAAQKLEKSADADIDPQVLEAIAAAYAANGKYPQAVKYQQRALKAARGFSWNTRAMDERLTAYAASEAWTGDLFALPPNAVPTVAE
jgi:TonB family protein